jgi:hypothetical protein
LISFGSPWWLAGLAPWAGLTLYMLMGRRRRVIVPFLELWSRNGTTPRFKRSWHRPPTAVAAVLATAFLAVLAAAVPRLTGGGTARPIVVIVDHGITMPAARLQRLAAAAMPDLLRILGDNPVEMVSAPGDSRSIPLTDLPRFLAQAPSIVLDSTTALANAARDALLDSQAIVVLLSDRKIDVSDPRLVQIVPGDKLTNIGITDFSVRAFPRPQAMVRLVNDSPLTESVLSVTGAAPQTVSLPAPGRSANYFIDLSAAPNEVEASIDPGGDIAIDDHAWARRGPSWPNVKAICMVPPELQRMLDVYRRHRPAEWDAKTLTIAPVGAEADAVIVTDSVPTTPPPPGQTQWDASPITAGLDFGAAMRDAQIATGQPGPDSRQVVWIGDHVLVAVRDAPARQAWIGFRSAAWATTPDFVVFWTRILDWLGQGDDQYIARVIAVPPLDSATPADWVSQLNHLAAGQPSGPRDLSSWALGAAMSCLLIAAAAWR